MDIEKRQKRQSLKVIISEAIMVVAVIITVIILALLVSGYWLNSDFEVERQGLLQISSIPTGANVSVDGEDFSWLQRTNTSRVLSSGEHTVKLTREGYDSWSKTITITEGLLYRLHYPRLFLTERETERVYDAVGTTKVFVSDNHETLLLYSGDLATLDTAQYTISDTDSMPKQAEDLSTIIPEWKAFDLTVDQPEPKPVSVRDLYDFFRRPKSTEKHSAKDFSLDFDLDGTEQLIFSKFYEDQYLTVVKDMNVSVFKRDAEQPVLKAELNFTPTTVTGGHNGEFAVFSTGSTIATLDMETLSIREWNVDGATYGWFDDDMIYSVKGGELFVYDFDGYNRRSLATNVSERFPVIVTSNKFLYYFSDDILMREWLITR